MSGTILRRFSLGFLHASAGSIRGLQTGLPVPEEIHARLMNSECNLIMGPELAHGEMLPGWGQIDAHSDLQSGVHQINVAVIGAKGVDE